MKRHWDKYEEILGQIWRDIGTNMKRYWDKYETCAKKTSMTLKLFAPHLLFQSLSLTLTSRERKCIIQLLSSFTICIWQNRLVASCLVCQTNKQIQFCIKLLHWKITLHFVSLKSHCSAMQCPTDHQCIISITIGSNQHHKRENWKMQWWRKRDTNTKGKIGKQERNTNITTNMKGRMGKYRCYESFTPPQSRQAVRKWYLLPWKHFLSWTTHRSLKTIISSIYMYLNMHIMHFIYTDHNL